MKNIKKNADAKAIFGQLDTGFSSKIATKQRMRTGKQFKNGDLCPGVKISITKEATLNGDRKNEFAPEQFPKTVGRFSDRNCGENKGLERLTEPSEIKIAPEQFPKTVGRFSDRNCGENEGLERLIEPGGAKTALDNAILKAAEQAGRHYGDEGLVSYLEAQAVATPSPFLTLLGKLLGRGEAEHLDRVTRIEIVAPAFDENNKDEFYSHE